MIVTGGEPLFTQEDRQAIRDRMEEIQARIRERAAEIDHLEAERGVQPEDEQPEQPAAEEATAERVEEIRQSVTDEAIKERVERTGHGAPTQDRNGPRDSGEGGVR